jgi:predicted DNA-binding protein
MLAIPIDPATEKRLAAAAARIGETPDTLAAKALQTYLEDLEDYALAVEAMKDARETATLDEMKRELGLDA